MTKILRCIPFFGLLCATVTFAQPNKVTVKQLTENISQYSKVEWEIIDSNIYVNPYNQKEVIVNMVLYSPSGKPIVLPCYFDRVNSSLSVWKARFAPKESGKYSYHFEFRSENKERKSAEMFFIAEGNEKPGFLAKNDNYTFKFDNGSLFRGIGENIGWESRSFEDEKWTYDYLLPSLSKNGANFFRTWMCYWNLPLEWGKVQHTKRYQNSTDYFNPGAIKRMDELLQLCDSLDLYFMLSLEWHGHFMEGMGWNNSPYNAVNGGPAKTPAEFFTSAAAQEKFKNKLRYCVARWGYSTHIAAWEFFNEIDNAAFTTQDSILIPLNTIAQWHLEMSRYLKDIDPYGHMVTTSISHRDIIGMNSVPYIDFNQKHIYKHTGKIPAIYPTYISNFGKPYVIGEFGYRWEDADPKYGEAWDYDFKRGLWYGLFSPTPILPMSWWWELFDDRQMAPYFKGVREISDRMLKSGNGKFDPFSLQSGKLEGYGVKCGSTYFIYLQNNTKEEINATISFSPGTNAIYSIQRFNPSTYDYQEVKDFKKENDKINIRQLSLKGLKECILIINSK